MGTVIHCIILPPQSKQSLPLQAGFVILDTNNTIFRLLALHQSDPLPLPPPLSFCIHCIHEHMSIISMSQNGFASRRSIMRNASYIRFQFAYSVFNLESSTGRFAKSTSSSPPPQADPSVYLDKLEDIKTPTIVRLKPCMLDVHKPWPLHSTSLIRLDTNCK